MATFEEELKRLEPIFKKLITFAFLGKEMEVKGKENFIKKGPNIIIGNHIGTFKDIATLLKIVPRPIFFTANKMIFSRDEFNFLIRKHLKRHLKEFGLFLNLILNPLKSLFVQFISTNIEKVGTIPVDLYRRKREVIEEYIEECQKYLKQGRVIIALQGRGRIRKKDLNPYVKSFGKGFSVIACKLYKNHGILVPVTPVAIFGTQIPFMIPGKIRVNIGHPMYVADYFVENEKETIEKFKNALEVKVKTLLLELLRHKQ